MRGRRFVARASACVCVFALFLLDEVDFSGGNDRFAVEEVVKESALGVGGLVGGCADRRRTRRRRLLPD